MASEQKKQPTTPASDESGESEARCPYCEDELLAKDETRACADCGARHHRDCWRELPGCSGCGGRRPARRERKGEGSRGGAVVGGIPAAARRGGPAHSGLGIASIIVAGLALCVVGLFELIFAATTLNPRATEYAIGATRTMAWAAVLSVPTVALLLAVAGAAARDRNRTTGLVGLIASVVILLGGILITFELGRMTPARERPGGVAAGADGAWRGGGGSGGGVSGDPWTPFVREVPDRTYPEPDPDPGIASSGEPLRVAWTDGPLGTGSGGDDGASRGGLAVVGEADPDYDPQPTADEPIGGPPSVAWARASMQVEKRQGFDRHRVAPVANARFYAAMTGGDDARTILIWDASSPGAPRKLQPEADVNALALSGNRLLATHGQSPFLSAFDAASGELLAEKQIPQGAASHVTLRPRHPRLAYLYAGGEFVGFDAGRLAFVGAHPYTDDELYPTGSRFRVGGAGRYAYAWRTSVSPSGVIVLDAQRGFHQVMYDHDSWSMQPDDAGRFVFTSNGTYRAGLTERIDETPRGFLGTMSDGNVLVVNHDRRNDGVTLQILDPRSAATLRTIPLQPPPEGDARHRRWDLGYGQALSFVPGTNRILVRTKQAFWYRDIPAVSEAIAEAGDAMPLAPAVPGKAFFGEAWRVPIDPDGEVDALRVTIDAAPRGVSWDAKERAVVWTPSRIQKGEHHVQITVSAPGYEDLVLSERVEARYRILALTQAKDFGVLPGERFIWWTTSNELWVMDPVTKEKRGIGFEEAPRGLVESNGRLFTALGQSARIVELALADDALEVTRSYKHSFPGIEGLAPHPDGRTLSCISSDDAGRMLVCRIPIDGGEGVARPVPTEQGGPWRHAGNQAWGRESTDYRVFWLDGERFAIGNRQARGYDPFSRGNGIPTFRWGDEGNELDGTVPSLPRAQDAEGRLYLDGAIHDADGTRLKTHENAAVSPSVEGTYYASLGTGRREGAVRLSFFDLPNCSRLTSMSFEAERGSYSNAFTDGWLVSRAHVVLAKTTTTFTEGFQVWFLPYEESDLGR